MSLKPGLGVAFQVYFDIEIGGEKAGACILPPSTLVGFYLVRKSNTKSGVRTLK